MRSSNLPMDEQVSGLHRLNDDVLIQIFELLRPHRELRSLSATCKSLRRSCVPSLFKRCIINVNRPMVPERLLPPDLRPHCQSLSIMDDCPDQGGMTHKYRRLHYTDDRLLCGVMDGQILKAVLSDMPHLRTISISFLCKAVHGLSWKTLASILSVRQLENFTLQRFNFSPRPRLPFETDTIILAPLKSFRCIQPAFHWIPQYFPPERDALADVLERLHESLELLHLPSLSAPMDTLSMQPWPHMRKLELQGQLPENINGPFITLLSGMPKLRVLHLKFALPCGVDRQSVWPRGVDTAFPWPELEELVLSFPTPDDQLYSFLPSCLRRLSLPCCPHRCVHEWVGRPEWHSPVLSASEMLRVISRCQLPHLDHLQFEYRADDADGPLLRHLIAAFPELLTLEVHRFRPAGVEEIPMVAIGEEIRSLRRLHNLSIHLDSPDHPEPSLEAIRMGGVISILHWEEKEASDRMLQAQVDLLAPLLGRSVRLLRVVQREGQGASWRAYRICRADDTGDVVDVRFDAAHSTEDISPDWFVELNW